jgi:lysophospholipase L1-like esterase
MLRILIMLMLALGMTSTDPADATPPPKIMVVGDSITHGFSGDYTWRYFLYKEFVRQGRPVNFVGPRNTIYGTSNFYIDSNFDKDHEALGGSKFDSHLAGEQQYLETYNPDVIVLALGRNDLNHEGTPAEVLDDIHTYIDVAQAYNPNIKIAVSEILYANAGADDGLVDEVNDNLNFNDPNITVVNTNSNENLLWNPDEHTFDGTHPTPTAQTLIAHRVGQALARLGVLDPEVHIYQNLSWPTNSVPTFSSVNTTKVTVSWNRDKYRMTSAKVKMTKPDGTSTIFPYDYRTGYAVITGLKSNTTYKFQVQPKRGTMVGNWSSVASVTTS